MSDIRSKAHDTTRYDACPNPRCLKSDVRGPYDSAPTLPHGHFTRGWYCRTCWWAVDITLRDEDWDAARKKGSAA